MPLTKEQIEKLAARKGVKRIAVENSLMSLSGNKAHDYANIEVDARLYKWNAATLNAILKGVSLS